jgi:basic amino acid/polyamine antiporter, APA family
VYQQADGDWVTNLGLPPEEGGFTNDPVLGVVKNLGLDEGPLLNGLEVYVGVLAATILFIATNAGVIGASRITYAMSGYRQLPLVFRRLHPKFKTPWLALVVFAGIGPILTILPGNVTFLGTMYSFGATLSFTVAHSSIIALRARKPDPEALFFGRPNLRVGAVNWPIFAILGALGTGIAFLVIVLQDPATRWAGIGWLVVGFVGYVIYRRRVLDEPLSATVRAPAMVLGPSLTAEYRMIVVPVTRTAESEEAIVAAARLAVERRGTIVLVHVLEVPMELPLDAPLVEYEMRADELLDSAQALVEEYGVRGIARLVRARSAGPAIVEEALRRNAELIAVGAPRGRVRASGQLFGRTADYVLKNSPVRVLLTGGRQEAA